MKKEARISAQISTDTRALMERYTRQTGVKKGHLVEQALLHHLQALSELPAGYMVSPRLVVSWATGEQMLEKAQSPEPTPELRELIRDGD
jgi:hypothetical protein